MTGTYRRSPADFFALACVVVALLSFLILPLARHINPEGQETFSLSGLQLMTMTELPALLQPTPFNAFQRLLLVTAIALVIGLGFSILGLTNAGARQSASNLVAAAGAGAFLFFVMYYLNSNANIRAAGVQTVIGAGFWVCYLAIVGMILQSAAARPEATLQPTPKIHVERITAAQQQRSALLASTAQQSIGEYISTYIRRVRSGDLGPLPIIIGIVGIALFFQSRNENFLTPRNIVNLILQMSHVATIAYGIVFILLLGEIDLSAGFVGGVAGVLVTVSLRPPFGVDWAMALSVGLATAMLIGFLQGMLITVFQLPSFIVTLAGLLGWNGVVLLLVGEGGTIRIPASPVQSLAGTFLDPTLGWVVAGLVIAAYTAMQIIGYIGRRNQGLNTRPLPIIIFQIVVLSAFAIGIVAICNQDRGLPFVGVLLIIILIVLTYIARGTRFGRYVFAVGGNKEAASRAGIRVERIRLQVFMLCSFMAGLGGIILASRLQSVAPNQGGGQLLLNVIAAAVIGGTSLFGGRGAVYSALLGALVIASLENGMVFLGVPAAVQFIITGVVLVLAVIIDSLSRRSQKRSGLA
ncbi:MAG: hypothetical protein OHK0023_07600 [Anaerolineae bacterium]